MSEIQAVDPKPYLAGVASVARSCVVVATSAVALSGFLSRHDWRGLAEYVQSGPFTLAAATVASAMVAGGTALYGAWKAYERSHQLAKAADDPRNEAIVRK